MTKEVKVFDKLLDKKRSTQILSTKTIHSPVLINLKTEHESYLLKLSNELFEFASLDESMSCDFTLEASDFAWRELQKPFPKPGFQCLSTMRRTRNLIVKGDTKKFNQHLMLLEMLFSNIIDSTSPNNLPGTPFIEKTHGQYLNLSFENSKHRIFFEEAGTGIPLVCLHTAGSDSRQYRHLLNDTDITKNFRVIAFDLPWHGKSSPPAEFAKREYLLTTKTYKNLVITFIDALGLEKPIIMGCSIGGRAVLHLALSFSNKLGGVIGLQSALFAEDRSIGDPNPKDILYRSDVHGGELAGALMAGMTAPQSPQNERWETMWHYMQGGPGVFKGDLNYYFDDGDLRDAKISDLKNSSCPIYLLNGDYDVSATPEMGNELAKLINPEHFEIMENMGHFPMSENPERFKLYLVKVLDKIINRYKLDN